jgi:hypothetical protein
VYFASAVPTVVPLAGDQLAVPGQQGARGDGEDAGPAVPGYQRGQSGKPEPVRRLVAHRRGQLSAQHRVRVPQYQHLRSIDASRCSSSFGSDRSPRTVRYASDTIITTASQTIDPRVPHLQR